jgi:hypothetical protein
LCPVSPTGAGHMARRAARLMASRALPRHCPASAALQLSPGDAITTVAHVCPGPPGRKASLRMGRIKAGCGSHD